MMIRKTLLAAAAAIALLSASVGAAYASYVGDWSYDNNPGGLEILSLGDNTDGSFIHLRGTNLYCVKPGVPYATIRNLLVSNGTDGQQVTWWIDHECNNGDYDRICVENSLGQVGCSTYWVDGWYDSE